MTSQNRFDPKETSLIGVKKHEHKRRYSVTSKNKNTKKQKNTSTLRTAILIEKSKTPRPKGRTVLKVEVLQYMWCRPADYLAGLITDWLAT